MFEAMRRGCRMIANFFGEREPRNSKARQGRAVMPVETGEIRNLSQDRISPKTDPLSSGKPNFSQWAVLRRFPAFPERVACATSRRKPMQNKNLVHSTRYAGRSTGPTRHISAAMPFVADLRNGISYASWPVWSGSTTKEARFAPMPRKVAIRIYHKAVEWNRRDKFAGRHGGLVGSHVLLVLHTLIFDFLNHSTGRLDPSYNAIQRKTRLCRQTVATALARLKQLGIINWIRRCSEDHDEHGRFVLRQETNAYALLPSTQWRNFMDIDVPEPPHPATWGASPPLPSLLEQASGIREEGGSLAAAAARLDADPNDTLAATLASLGRALGIH